MYLNPDVKVFLETPSEKTFEKITKYAPSLLQVLKENWELAVQYFQFDDWLALKNNGATSIDAETEQFIKDKLKESVSSFKDALRYYRTLCPTAQKLYAQQLINFAMTEEDLETLTKALSEDYIEAIEKRRKEIHSSSMENS